jgi:O-antigen ligase
MTLLADSSPSETRDDPGPTRRPRSADAATILAILVVLQFVLPSRLVLNGIPLSLSAATLVALSLGALWLATQCTLTLGAAKGSTPVRTALFAYALVLIASFGSASATYLPPDERHIGTHGMVMAFALIFVALATCDGVRSRNRIYFLVQVLVICGAVVASVGVVQYVFGYDLSSHLRPPGMHFSSIGSAVGSRDGLNRASGTTANPLEFGVVCAMVLPLALHLAFVSGLERRSSRLWWTCVGLLMGGLLFSVSRSAIVALVCAMVVLLLGWSARRRTRMLLAGAGFLVLIKVIAPGLLGTFLSLFQNAHNDDSVQWRTHDYATAKQLISLHPWLGRGIGTWYAPKHEVFDNQYLLTLVDSGTIGLVAFLAVFVAGTYAALRVLLLSSRVRLRSATGPTGSTDRDLALSLIASLAVVFPSFATFDFAAFATVSTLTFVLVGMASALLRIVTREINGEQVDPDAVV